jgi:hypothetical protein
MVWKNHCRSKELLLWIVIVISLSISHLFHEWIDISLAFFHKDIQVFLIFKYSQITLLVSEKTKKKLCLWGFFSSFTWVFCVIKRIMGAF